MLIVYEKRKSSEQEMIALEVMPGVRVSKGAVLLHPEIWNFGQGHEDPLGRGLELKIV